MAVQYLDFPENPLNLHKFKKHPQKITNLKSFWAFLLSIFIYISIFYIFNLSPSTVLSTTEFWFFISNTIILIIAADFGSFSASKENGFYEDYVKNARTRNISSFRTQQIPYDQKEEITDEKLPEEKIIEMAVQVPLPVPVPVALKNTETKEEDKQIITANEDVEFLNEKKQEIDQNKGAGQEKEKKKKKKKAKYVRFNSEKIMIAPEEEENFVLQRSLSDVDEGRVEENEFSAMSDEELNRRVEEFIRRFNRQIRDQAVKYKH